MYADLELRTEIRRTGPTGAMNKPGVVPALRHPQPDAAEDLDRCGAAGLSADEAAPTAEPFLSVTLVMTFPIKRILSAQADRYAYLIVRQTEHFADMKTERKRTTD